MSKPVKIFVTILGTVIILSIIFFTLLAIFVKPEHLKPIISAQVQKYTGRKLSIAGEMQWSFFPNLGFKISRITFDNPNGFIPTSFAEIGRATLSIKLMPLLHGSIEIREVELSDTTIHLIKNPSGITNWQDLMTPPANEKTAASEASTENTSRSSKFTLKPEIPRIVLSNAAIDWNNQQTKQTFALKQLNLDLKNIGPGRSSPARLSFNFEAPESKFSGKVNMTSQAMLDLSQRMFVFNDLNLSTQMRTETSNKTLGATLKSVTVRLTDQATTASIAEGDLQYDQFKLSHLNAEMKLQNDVLQIDPLKARFYQGDLEAHTKTTLATPEPQLTVNAKLSGVQVGPLLADLRGQEKSSLKIQGIGNIDLKINTQGSDAQKLTQNLNGTTQFSFKNGILEGINISHFIQTAAAFFRKEPTPQSPSSNQTEFGNLTGTGKITQGIIENNDLLIDSPSSITRGQGTIDLVKQEIDFELNTTLKSSEAVAANKTLSQLTEHPVPIRVTGKLDHPSVRLNVEAIAKDAAQQQIEKVKEKFEEKAGEMLQNFLKR